MTVLDLSPSVLDIIGYAGDTTELVVTVTRSGAAVDLTGATAAAHIRKTAHSTEAAVATATIEDAANGVVKAVWSGADLAALTSEVLSKWVGKYDVELTLATGEVWSILRGDFTILRDITRGA